MIAADQASAADVPSEVADQIDEAALTEVMRLVPIVGCLLPAHDPAPMRAGDNSLRRRS